MIKLKNLISETLNNAEYDLPDEISMFFNYDESSGDFETNNPVKLSNGNIDFESVPTMMINITNAGNRGMLYYVRSADGSEIMPEEELVPYVKSRVQSN